jgi:nicotinamide mononucleotide (NMN) deamidase PncC
MPQQATDSEPKEWHKRFAAQANNRAWELSVLDRTAEQDREMLDAAHASAWHWSAVGTELNRMRATMLLAEVHALLGFGASALHYAEEMRTYFVGRETADWELAFTHVIHAHAASAAGAVETHRIAYGNALVAIKAIADEEDRTIVNKTFQQVPVTVP